MATKRIHLAIAALALLALAARAQDTARTVSFVTDPEKQGGYLVAISVAALQRVGYTADIRYMPWARALQMTLAGQAEALLGAYYSDARNKDMAYTDQIGKSELVFFKLIDTNITFHTLKDLRDYRIGTIIGASYTPEFDRAPDIAKEPASNYEVNLRKLMARRIPLMLEKKSLIRAALADKYAQFAPSIVALDKPLASIAFYNTYSRRYAGYQQKVADFNRGLALLAADGGLQKILDQNLHE